MIDYSGLPARIEAMSVQDVGEVLEIERVSFSAPWSARAYEYELRYNEMAHYFVARANEGAITIGNGGKRAPSWLNAFFRPAPQLPSSGVIGYVGFWLMAGEAHISTIAVKPELRGRSFGELLLVAAVDKAMEMGAHVATLEVRVSNKSAQELYLKYGFEKVGLRKGYYSDNNEDAYIMTTPALGAGAYQQKFSRLKQALFMHMRENAPARRGR